MWRSKLGNEFDKSQILQDEPKLKAELDRLRKLPENRICADCGTTDGGNVWASVNLGVFLCIRCGSIHRGLGTHISIPKGCTGSYLWGPDEIDRMKSIGNRVAKQIYGGDNQRPSRSEADALWKQYMIDKYEKRKFAPPARLPPTKTSSLEETNTESTADTPNAAISNDKKLQTFSKYEKRKISVPITSQSKVTSPIGFTGSKTTQSTSLSSKEQQEAETDLISFAEDTDSSPPAAEAKEKSSHQIDFFAEYGL